MSHLGCRTEIQRSLLSNLLISFRTEMMQSLALITSCRIWADHRVDSRIFHIRRRRRRGCVGVAAARTRSDGWQRRSSKRTTPRDGSSRPRGCVLPAKVVSPTWEPAAGVATSRRTVGPSRGVEGWKRTRTCRTAWRSSSRGDTSPSSWWDPRRGWTWACWWATRATTTPRSVQAACGTRRRRRRRRGEAARRPSARTSTWPSASRRPPGIDSVWSVDDLTEGHWDRSARKWFWCCCHCTT